MTNLFTPFDAPSISLPSPKKKEKTLSDNEKNWRNAILLDDENALEALINQGEMVRVTKTFNPWTLALDEGTEKIRKILAKAQVSVGDQQLFVERVIQNDCLPSLHYFLSLIKQKPNDQLDWNSLLHYAVQEKSLLVTEEILLGDTFLSVYPKRQATVSSSYLSFFTSPQASQAPVLWANSLLKVQDISSLFIKKPETLGLFFEKMVKAQTPDVINRMLQDRPFWSMEHTLLFQEAVKYSPKMSQSLNEVLSHTCKYSHVKVYKKFGVKVPKASLHGTSRTFLERQFINGCPLFEDYVKTDEGRKALKELLKNQSFLKEFLSRATPKTAIKMIEALDLASWRDEYGHNPSHYILFNNQGIQAVSAIIKHYPFWLSEENNEGKTSLSLLSGEVRNLAEKAILEFNTPNKPSSLSRKM